MNMRDAYLEDGRITIDQKLHRDGAERLSGGADHLQFAGARRPAETRRSVEEAPYRVFENTALARWRQCLANAAEEKPCRPVIGEAEYFAKLARTDRSWPETINCVASNHLFRGYAFPRVSFES